MDIILKYFPKISSSQTEQYSKLLSLYTFWNEKINVISRKDIDLLYERHVLHSLGIAKVMEFNPQSSVLDVGTGGGFPGIPLAIMFPEVQFTLIDSIGKKINVVKEITKDLGLLNVVAENKRAEDVDEKFDFVVSRAVTRLKPFHGWVKSRFLKGSHNRLDNGILYLKGGDLDEELAESGLRYKIFELADYFQEDFFTTKKVVYVPIR